MRRHLIAALLLFLTTLPAIPAWALEWQVDDDHSNAYFSVQHLTVSRVRGAFNNLTGSVSTDERTGAVTSLCLGIEVKSLDTGVSQRDEDLKSPNFLNLAEYPDITYTSTKVVASGDNTMLVTGDMVIHGVSKEVQLTLSALSPEIKDPWGLVRRGLRLEGRLNRQDFGITYNKTLDNGGLLIGDLVEVGADIEIVKGPAK